MSRNDGHQYDQQVQGRVQAAAQLLAGSKTSSLHAGRVHHRIHRQSRVWVEGLVDLVMLVNKNGPDDKVTTAYNLPPGTGGGEAGCSTGTGGAGTRRDSGGGGAGTERSGMVSRKDQNTSMSGTSHPEQKEQDVAYQ
jgi:hypothetical protein